jgi:hypothetical protein
MSPPTTIPTYRLGDVIPLEDLLALPPDGRRYGRDARGRLCLMSPERVYLHRLPISLFGRTLSLSLHQRHHVLFEGSLALPQLVRMDGGRVPPSRLGPRSIEPDVMVFEGYPRPAGPDGERAKSALVDRLRLVVVVLSESIWGCDLGIGDADEVDRWRSYLLSGVPELWLVNAGVEADCPLPPGAALFLRNQGDAWAPLEVEDAVLAPCAQIHGVAPVTGGRVRSGLGLELDVTAYFAAIRAAIEEARQAESPPPA